MSAQQVWWVLQEVADLSGPGETFKGGGLAESEGMSVGSLCEEAIN